jgi:dienelactone hydrolase
MIYDIRGFNIIQTRVFCDRLAADYRSYVVMPDFFRGQVAPSNFTQLPSWLSSVADWPVVSTDLRNVANWLRTNSSNRQVALLGFCWGGLQAVRGCSNLSDLFLTGISIHGSSITPNEVRLLRRPMLFIAARDDPPLQPNISSVIEQTNLELSRSFEYKTYSYVQHGFAAAGANYSNPENVRAIDDVHQTVRNFLDRQRSNDAASVMKNVYSIMFVLLCIVFDHTK